jgi:low affinity Fe/Cu permease
MANIRVPAGKWYEQLERRRYQMLWTVAVVLIILWMLGLVTGYTMGNFIHILLVIAIIVVLVRVIQGRKPL